MYGGTEGHDAGGCRFYRATDTRPRGAQPRVLELRGPPPIRGMPEHPSPGLLLRLRPQERYSTHVPPMRTYVRTRRPGTRNKRPATNNGVRGEERTPTRFSRHTVPLTTEAAGEVAADTESPKFFFTLSRPTFLVCEWVSRDGSPEQFCSMFFLCFVFFFFSAIWLFPERNSSINFFFVNCF